MSFFGIQVSLLQITLNKIANIIIYYCNFTATRKDCVEKMNNIHTLTHIYGAMWTKKPIYIQVGQFLGQLWIRLLWVRPKRYLTIVHYYPFG
jgi:hypothetical protein